MNKNKLVKNAYIITIIIIQGTGNFNKKWTWESS